MINQRLKRDLSLNRLYNSYLIRVDNYNTGLEELKSFVLRELLGETADTHPDFVVVEKESGNVKGISVDRIRILQKFLYKTSVISGKKVAVIVGAEQMNLNASNSCLKILEDTPANSYLFLLTKNSASILPTIRSRCAKINVTGNNKEPIADEKYLRALLKSTPFSERLAFIKEFATKDRDLWVDFSSSTESLLCRLTKQAAGCNVELAELEKKLLSQFSSRAPEYILYKFEKVRALIDDTINFDLDLQASCALLIDNFRN
jgi:DNA polymerase-3 subunit delta'